MAIWGDYHTHTTYSHGTGSVMDNVLAAKEKGLKEIAITDHGLRHWAFNIKYKELPMFFKDVEEANRLVPEVRTLKGIENNLDSVSGHFDAPDEILDELDIIMGGYHKAVHPKYDKDFWGYVAPNLVGDVFKHFTKSRFVKNTDAYLNLIENYDIDFIVHINYGLVSDALEVARFAKQKGTFIELNGKRVNFTDCEIEKMTEEGVVFILSSDAHSPDRVGDFSLPMSYVDRLHIPYEQIANWERIPDFRSRKKKR